MFSCTHRFLSFVARAINRALSMYHNRNKTRSDARLHAIRNVRARDANAAHAIQGDVVGAGKFALACLLYQVCLTCRQYLALADR